jgi:molecular chaperone DnaJ
MSENYYVIMGVARNATPEEIKAAFRRRAMELHPDRSGSESGPFIEVQEAYGVLSDPERRRHYDAQASMRVRRQPWGWSAEPFAPARNTPESFRDVTPVSDVREFGFAPDWAEFHPSFDELFERLWANFEMLSRPKSERLESLTIEVVLGANEARSGGRVRVNIPARVTRTTCGGRGAVGPYECWRCEGHGALAGEYPLDIPYPSGVRDGYVVRVPLARFGIENFYLTVLVRVSTTRGVDLA